MNSWKNPKVFIPDQGKKVLCMNKGDFYVAQRMGEYWLSIPFCDSKYAYSSPPDLWCEIDFPEGFTGKLHFGVDGEMLDLDEFEKRYPDQYMEFLGYNVYAFLK